MKKALTLFISIVLVLFPAISFSFRTYRPAFTPNQLITVFGTSLGDTMSEVKIEPFKKTFVGITTKVSWVNRSDTPIHIKFGKGTDCRILSKSYRQTSLWRSRTCYVTGEPIAPGDLYRITFDEKGSYLFEIRFVGTTTTFQGELVVH